MNDRYHDAHAPHPPKYTGISKPTIEELIAVGSPLEPAKQTRWMPVVGKSYHTKQGDGVCMAITPYQVQIAPADGDEPFWVHHAGVLIELAEPEDIPAYSLKDLVYAIADLVAQLKDIIDEAERTEPEDCGDTQQVETT